MYIKFTQNVNLEGTNYTTDSDMKSVTAETGASLIAAGLAYEVDQDYTNVLPLERFAWADRPDATLNDGVVIRITDIGGSAGSRWISDGTYWKPESGRVVLGSGAGTGVTGYIAPHDTNENILASVTVPAYAMNVNGILRINQSWSMTNSANVKTMSIRMGGISGTQIYSAPQTTILTIRTIVEIQNRNSTVNQIGATGSGNGLVASANSALFTGTIDTAVEKIIVFTGKKDAASAAASENLTLERYVVELITP